MFLLTVLPKTVVSAYPLGANQNRRARAESAALALDDIPRSLPALMRAQKIQNVAPTLVSTGRRLVR